MHLDIYATTGHQENTESQVLLQSMLRTVGIDVSIRNYPGSYLFAMDGPLYTGKYDLEWSIETNGPDPDNSGDWNGAFIPPRGANTSWLNDPIVNATSAAAASTFDLAARKRLYQREEARLREVVPAVFFSWRMNYTAMNDDLKNYVPARFYRRQLECLAVEHLNLAAFAQVLRKRETARLYFEPARSGVLSWNTHADSGRIAFRLLRARQPCGDWLDLAEWRPGGAKSFSPVHEGMRVNVDVIEATQPFDGIEVHARDVEFELVAFSSPVRARTSLPYGRDALILDVPARSQYPSTESDSGRGSSAPLGASSPEENAAGAVRRAFR